MGISPDDIVLEAEDFSNASPDGLVAWTELTDSAASGARYVAVLNGLADDCAPDPGQVASTCLPQVSFDITVESEDDFYIYLEGRGQDDGLGAAWSYFNDGTATLHAWQENDNQFRFGESVPVPTTLAAGAHTVHLALSQDGTGVDRIVVSTSNETP